VVLTGLDNTASALLDAVVLVARVTASLARTALFVLGTSVIKWAASALQGSLTTSAFALLAATVTIGQATATVA